MYINTQWVLVLVLTVGKGVLGSTFFIHIISSILFRSPTLIPIIPHS